MFTLHNGDCIQVMPLLEAGSIDAIITDLPYGTTACKWDTVIEFAPMWKEVKRVLKPNGSFITTASQPFTSALIMSNPKFFKYEMIWNKVFGVSAINSKTRPMQAHENILLFYEKTVTFNPIYQERTEFRKTNPKHRKSDIDGRGYIAKDIDFIMSNKKNPVTVITINRFEKECNPVKRIHPTQKPVALYEYLIKTYTNEGETVLDIAMGSGTTIEAAERTGRNSIGIEKDEGIFQSAVLRLKSFTPSNNRLQWTGGESPTLPGLSTPEV